MFGALNDVQDFDADVRIAGESSGVVADAVGVGGVIDAGQHVGHRTTTPKLRNRSG
jgi:predicted NAD/FAD-binding protein